MEWEERFANLDAFNLCTRNHKLARLFDRREVDNSMNLLPWNMKQRNARIVDLSHYDVMPNFAELVRGGVDGVIFKEDEMTAIHVTRARAAGMFVMGLYGWVNPNRNGIEQALEFIAHLELYGIPSGWADCEQEYKYFNEYVAYLKGRMTWSQVTKIPLKDIRRVFMDYVDTLDAWGAANNKRTGIYSRWELLRRVFREDTLWLMSKIHWSAFYTWYRAFIAKTWDQVWSKLPWLPFRAIERMALVEPEGWQFTGDRLVIPGVKSAADISIFRGTIEELFAWLGIKALPEPEPLPYLTAHLKPQFSALCKRPGAADFSRVVEIIHAEETIAVTKDVRQMVGQSTWAKLWGEECWINVYYIDFDVQT